jgi:hypothetical protein
VRKYVQDVWDESAEDGDADPGHRPLETGELPPYDSDAT